MKSQVKYALRQARAHKGLGDVHIVDYLVYSRNEGDGAIGALQFQQGLQRLFHDACDETDFAEVVVHDSPAFPGAGRFPEHGLVYQIAADKAVAARKPLGKIERFHPLEGHISRVIVKEPDVKHRSLTWRIRLRRNEGDFVALFEQKGKARRATHDEPSF